jgi:methylenetetrahydrofolate dehydrogenase (NADP+)/methenyltetrahydrofolate cyclohydrolase
METVIFDGKAAAAQRQVEVTTRVKIMVSPPVLASIFFSEDEGSVLYTKLKKQAALAAGIAFEECAFSIRTSKMTDVTKRLKNLNDDNRITGIIIQKPTQAVWQTVYQGKLTFDEWWQTLTRVLALKKDVDCLTRAGLRRLRQAPNGLMPATVKAVLLVIEASLQGESLIGRQVAIIGCSDIIGLPLADILRHYKCQVTCHCGQIDLAKLAEAEIVVSAIGEPHCITGQMIRSGAIVVDVGSPRGDVQSEGVIGRARFLSPVPGGVGPLTVVCLLENMLELIQ